MQTNHNLQNELSQCSDELQAYVADLQRKADQFDVLFDPVIIDQKNILRVLAHVFLHFGLTYEPATSGSDYSNELRDQVQLIGHNLFDICGLEEAA